ncbi:MAG: hypothetical protein IKZ98_03465 [Clostridia bacterium]|nr:hypothetical protein [Clostridia bacterium]
MKKSLTALLVLMLLAVLCACAGAEEAGGTDLFDLWDYGGESMTWIAAVIPINEGAVITSTAVLPEDTEHLAVSDGKSIWEARAVLRDDDGLLALVFYDSTEKPERCEPWTLLPLGASADVEDCVVRTGDSMGSRINVGVQHAQEVLRDRRCELLSLTGRALPGSPVLTAEGQLAGIVVAEWSEGVNQVLAITPEEIIYTWFRVSALLQNLPEWQDMPVGMDVTIQRNLATIEWTDDLKLPDMKEGETLYLVVVDTGNDFIMYNPVDPAQHSVTLLLTPGRFYMAGFVATAETPEQYPETYATFGMPVAQPLTEYGFRPLMIAIAEAPEGGLKENEAPVPVAEVTKELLRSGRAYFYSSAAYEVTEDVTNQTLVITLTAPDGVCYSFNTGWSYLKDCMEEDIWFLSLKDIGLTEGLERKDYPEGIYRVAYYVNGYLADTFEFELK